MGTAGDLPRSVSYTSCLVNVDLAFGYILYQQNLAKNDIDLNF